MHKALVIFTMAAVLAGCSESGSQNYRAYDRNGVPLERGDAECKSQALKANVENTSRYFAVVNCLRLRGY